MIYFVLYLKLEANMGFLQIPERAQIFYASRFLYVLPEMARNELLLATHAFHLLFNKILPQMNNILF